MFVITADQKKSRRAGDRVPDALEALANRRLGRGVTRGFERTAGDEVQGIVSAPDTVVAVVSALSRLGGWRIGIGIGDVDRPLPRSTRAGLGPAFLAAREAVNAARGAPTDLAVRHSVGTPTYAEASAERAESALWMLVTILQRRTEQGWEIAEIMDTGVSGLAAAKRLGISASAVSQRAASAGLQEARRGAALAAWLLGEADA